MVDILLQVRKYRIIVALRGIQPKDVTAAARALYDGGIRLLEITFDQADPNTEAKTADAISAVRREFTDRILVGAGTVLTPDQAKVAVEAGAEYLLSPHFDPTVVTAARALNVPSIPGAFTPSEVAAAWEAGASMVKLFPAGKLGIPYLKDMAAPLGHIPLLPMGGVDLANMNDYLALSNVAGIGIGSAIVKRSLIEKGDFEGLCKLARSFTEKLPQ